MQIVPIRCFKRRCLRLKIVDFENTPITDLVHPETGEEVGDLRVVAYDAVGLPVGEHVYAKGSSSLDLCRVDRGGPAWCSRPLFVPTHVFLPPIEFPRSVVPLAARGAPRMRRGLLAGSWWKSSATMC